MHKFVNICHFLRFCSLAIVHIILPGCTFILFVCTLPRWSAFCQRARHNIYENTLYVIPLITTYSLLFVTIMTFAEETILFGTIFRFCDCHGILQLAITFVINICLQVDDTSYHYRRPPEVEYSTQKKCVYFRSVTIFACVNGNFDYCITLIPLRFEEPFLFIGQTTEQFELCTSCQICDFSYRF